METRRRTWFDDRGLVLTGLAAELGGAHARHLPFYAGAMHYWRVPPERWAACLRAIHGLGLTIVETSVPWRVHEVRAGDYAWTGKRDLARFLELAAAAGLAVVLRPGPAVHDDLAGFGMPDRVLADDACQARTSRGTPAWLPMPPRAFPIPSYASAKFHAETRGWFAAVAEVVRSQLAPAGPVVAIGVDNATQMFFRLGAFDLDYHPDAVTWWREASGFEEPPREWSESDATRCALWVKHKDVYVARGLEQLSRSLDEVGLGEVARFHHLPSGYHGLFDVRAIQRAIGGPAGLSAHTPRAAFPELRRRAAALAGNATPVPIAFEVGVGFAPWLPPLDSAEDPARERDQLLTLLAAGVRGFDLVMAVERDRHYGAAITADGKVESHAAWIQPLLAALAEVEWTSLRRRAEIALVDMRADARFGSASCAIDPMTPVLAEVLGLGAGGAAELGVDPAAIAARRWQTAVARALELAQVPYAIVDEAAPEDELARYRAVIAPTGQRIDRGLWQRLRSLAEQRRAIVVIGPGTPVRDELDQPLASDLASAPKRIGHLEASSLDDSAGLAEALARLAGAANDAWQVERPDEARTMVFADPAGVVRVVFVASDALRPVTAVILAGEDAKQLRDPLSSEVFEIASGRASVALPARGIRMLLIG